MQEYGPTVTLQRNAVNTFTGLNVGMVEQPTPQPDDFNTVATGDFIGLNLSGMVPGPLGTDAGGFVDIDDPATEPAPGANPHGGFRQRLTGVNLRLNADIDQAGGGGGGGGGGGAGGGNAPAPAPAPPPPTVALPVLPPANPLTIGAGNLLGTTASLPITCALDTTCAGLVQLLNQAQRAKAKKPKPTNYGSARFSIPAHQTANVKVRLNAAGKKLVKKRGSVRLVAKTTVGGQVTTTPVTLKRAATPKKHRKR